MYHRVLPKQQRDSIKNPAVINIVSDRMFEQQICAIKSDYYPCTLDELQSLLGPGSHSGKTRGRLPVVVTFDDGYKDNLDIALPILEQHQVPATIYVSTAGLSEHVRIWWYELWDILAARSHVALAWQGRQCSWDTATAPEKIACYLDIADMLLGLPLTGQDACLAELRGDTPQRYYDDICLTCPDLVRLDRHPLITIGAHTHHHPNLRALSYEAAHAEMLQSKQTLERLLGHPVDHFAYPHGDVRSAAAREFALSEACGFRTAVTTRTGKVDGHNWFALPRTSIREEHTAQRVSVKLSGWNTLWRRDL